MKRTESMLEQYEEKLQLFHKFQKRTSLLENLVKIIQNNDSKEEVLSLVDEVKKLD
ncbi:MAG TPA: hypothetical protein VLA13_05615 [Massilibacterium sp.]|nr:hypothetical protein [Massilibacterium sp.]